MNKKSIRMSLIKDGKEKTWLKVNGILREKDLKMERRKKMWHLKISLMRIDRGMGCNNNNNNIEVRALVGWSVVHVVRNTSGEIFHGIRMKGLRYTVHRRRRLLGMFIRLFHLSM